MPEISWQHLLFYSMPFTTQVLNQSHATLGKLDTLPINRLSLLALRLTKLDMEHVQKLTSAHLTRWARGPSWEWWKPMTNLKYKVDNIMHFIPQYP